MWGSIWRKEQVVGLGMGAIQEGVGELDDENRTRERESMKARDSELGKGREGAAERKWI